MSELQNTCLAQLSFEVPFFKRYVDDIVTAVPKDKCEELLSVFNGFHPKIQFTIEKESNDRIHFLDIEIIKDSSNILVTDWYHKPTFSERFLNFNSEHALKHKINIINNLKFRAEKLSDERFHPKNRELIKTFLHKNNYSLSLINKILNNNKQNKYNNNQENNNKYYKIPYVRNLSEKLNRTLTKNGLTVTYASENTIGKHFFTKLKEKIPKDLESNVVYEIPCSECNGVYIGPRVDILKNDCLNI